MTCLLLHFPSRYSFPFSFVLPRALADQSDARKWDEVCSARAYRAEVRPFCCWEQLTINTSDMIHRWGHLCITFRNILWENKSGCRKDVMYCVSSQGVDTHFSSGFHSYGPDGKCCLNYPHSEHVVSYAQPKRTNTVRQSQQWISVDSFSILSVRDIWRNSYIFVVHTT